MTVDPTLTSWNIAREGVRLAPAPGARAAAKKVSRII